MRIDRNGQGRPFKQHPRHCRRTRPLSIRNTRHAGTTRHTIHRGARDGRSRVDQESMRRPNPFRRRACSSPSIAAHPRRKVPGTAGRRRLPTRSSRRASHRAVWTPRAPRRRWTHSSLSTVFRSPPFRRPRIPDAPYLRPCSSSQFVRYGSGYDKSSSTAWRPCSPHRSGPRDTVPVPPADRSVMSPSFHGVTVRRTESGPGSGAPTGTPRLS